MNANPIQLAQGLSAVMAHYGHHLDDDDCINAIGGEAVKSDLALRAGISFLRKCGFVANTKRQELHRISPYSFPALIVMKNGDILVLKGVSGEYATVAATDASDMEQGFAITELKSQYSGIVILIKPENAAQMRSDGEYQKPQRNWLLSPILKNGFIYRDVVAASFVANLLASVVALFAMQVYDRVVPNKAFDTLWILTSGVVLAAAMEFILRLLRNRMIEASGRSIDLQLSSELFNRAIGIRMTHQPKSVGSFVAQLRELGSVREFLTSNTVSTVSDIPFSLVFLCIIGFIGGPVALVVAGAALIAILPGLLFRSRITEMSKASHQEAAIHSALIYESLSNIETIKATGSEYRLNKLHEDLTAVMGHSGSKSRLLTQFIMQISGLAQQFSYIGVVVVGVYQIVGGSMTMGALVACTILSSRALSPMGQVGNLVTRWQSVRSSVESLNKIMAMPVDRPEDQRFVVPTMLKGHYRVDSLEFGHPEAGVNSLEIKSLEFKPGERVALLGGIGSGKSTLLRLMAGLYDPVRGSVMIDNVSIGQIDPSFRRKRIGYLPQSVGVFQGTLRDNLSLAGLSRTDEEMLDALSVVGLGDYVRNHPRGLDLQISSAASLSGGQRQAVGLARIILQDPDVVLLDEPTASLDARTEAAIVGFMTNWLNGKTLIMATHKREVLPLTDRAIVLAQGKILKDSAVTPPQANAASTATRVPAKTAADIHKPTEATV